MQTGLGVADKIIGSGVHARVVGSVATGDTVEAVVPLDWLDPAAVEAVVPLDWLDPAAGDTVEAVVPLDWLDPAAGELDMMLPFNGFSLPFPFPFCCIERSKT